MSFDESEIYHDMPVFVTMSNPNKPGLAVLQFIDADGILMFESAFDLKEWESIDRAMRGSIGKYKEPTP